MQIYCKGMARIRDRTTGLIYEIESHELDWDTVGGDERQMGPELHYEASIEHPELGMLTWSLWEYPQGVENCHQTNISNHELIEDFDYGLEHVPEPDLWADYTLPKNPFAIFMDSYHHTGDLLADFGGNDGDHLLNRMIFSQQITALESYLGDTLRKAVLADKAAMTRLMTKDQELSKERFSLADIAKTPDIVENKIRDYLRSILYHNLPQVNFLYSAALQVGILVLAQDKAGLLKAILLRHDCVHRNGFDKDGEKLTIFTKDYVQGIADLIKNFVEAVEKQLRTRVGEA
ncbi:MAG: hypothetical protein AW11_03843 [Candidatus Accumulibacter regalis]|uniref:HEPN domain-containing protein n=2 Tax=Candidatus Accumulibacter TaxID=327159 RepID=A0A011PAC3_ACCRE|nr:MAG: hypothetical protein AW11_03843 [Candidatus Accumulibacter regalis]